MLNIQDSKIEKHLTKIFELTLRLLGILIKQICPFMSASPFLIVYVSMHDIIIPTSLLYTVYKFCVIYYRFIGIPLEVFKFHDKLYLLTEYLWCYSSYKIISAFDQLLFRALFNFTKVCYIIALSFLLVRFLLQ